MFVSPGEAKYSVFLRDRRLFACDSSVIAFFCECIAYNSVGCNVDGVGTSLSIGGGLRICCKSITIGDISLT